MHPILESKRRLGIYVAAWGPAGALTAILVAAADRRPWLEALALALPLTLVYSFMCLAAWFVCRSAALGEAGVSRIVTSHTIAALFTSGIWVLFGRIWARGLASVFGVETAPARFDSDLPLFFAVGALLYVLAAAVHYLMIAFESSRAAQRRALELQVLAREAQLQALKAQINPHFLFNSLNSISALAGSDPAASRHMCLLLAEFLRSSLRLGSKERIPLSDEAALAESFLAVERIRYGNRLRVDSRIEAEAGRCLVPPLLLQPLVENAVSHGVSSTIEGGVVRIEARCASGRLEIEVENPRDASRPAKRGEGVGLANVKARLDAIDPVGTRLDIVETPDRFLVKVLLPAVLDVGGGEAPAGSRAASGSIAEPPRTAVRLETPRP